MNAVQAIDRATAREPGDHGARGRSPRAEKEHEQRARLAEGRARGVNSRIRRLALGLLLAYVVLFVQLNILQVSRSSELNADVRNSRQTTRDFNRNRGPIITADGVVVADSVPSTDGRFTFQRRYPTGPLFAGITGYWSYAFGATQVEKVQDKVLAGRTSDQNVDALPNLFDRNLDTSGSVVLTLRADLQDLARQLLAGREGSVVMLDPRTGAVLAMYSEPTFDPNQIVVHTSADAEKALTFLNAAPGKPLLANAYQERYMPGSTFKVVTTTAALETGGLTLDRVFEVESSYTPPQTTDPIENYGGTSCGGDFATVFAKSCNTPFARLAVELGAEKMVFAADRFGLNEAPPIDLPRPAASHFGRVEDFTGNIPLLAIRGFGQNEDAITPLQMAMIAGSVANGGTMMIPYVVAETRTHGGGVLSRTAPRPWRTPMTPETAATLTQLMVKVVNEGTARCCMALANGVQAAAKTGTAQLNARGEPQRSHAWIMAFAPADNPAYAVSVVLKGTTDEISAGTGGRLAGPIAQQMLDAALAAGA